MNKEFINIEHEVIFNKLIEAISRKSDGSETLETLNNIKTLDSPHQYLNEIHHNLNIMVKNKENYAYRYIHSHRKVLGPVIIFTKRLIRKMLKWYIEPITFQQTTFNNAVTPAIGRTTEILTELINKSIEMNQEFLKKEQQLIQIQNENNELLIRLSNMENDYTDKVAQLKSEFSDKLAGIEERHNIYASQIDYATTKLDKLDCLDLFKGEEFTIFNKNTFSQSGEDCILAYIIYVLGIPFEYVEYIDLGANHAKEMSNTYFFYSKGAKGILVEANPQLIPELRFYRHRDVILNKVVDVDKEKKVDFYILNGDGLSTPDYESALSFCEKNPSLEIVEKVEVDTIDYNTIVEKYLGKAPTILSIDIEGEDLKILETINFDNYRPTLIVIEMISYDTKLNYQTKNNEIKMYLDKMDYDEYAFTGINSIFIDRRYLRERSIGAE